MPGSAEIKRLREQAWVGDAILALFARLYILANDGVLDAAKSARLTSNQFLSAFGEPTAVEARIGRIYQQQGLDAALAWIEAELLPRFLDRETRQRIQRHGGKAAVSAEAIAGGKPRKRLRNRRR